MTTKDKRTNVNHETNVSWGGRFSEGPDELVARLNASVSFDQRMYAEDIEGSQAHAQMLGSQGIIPQAESEMICEELERIKGEIRRGEWSWSIS